MSAAAITTTAMITYSSVLLPLSFDVAAAALAPGGPSVAHAE